MYLISGKICKEEKVASYTPHLFYTPHFLGIIKMDATFPGMYQTIYIYIYIYLCILLKLLVGRSALSVKYVIEECAVSKQFRIRVL